MRKKKLSKEYTFKSRKKLWFWYRVFISTRPFITFETFLQWREKQIYKGNDAVLKFTHQALELIK